MSTFANLAQTGSRFTRLNDGFVCAGCGVAVPPAQKTCRNHCPYCLVSRHVDVNPGDRAHPCQSLMDAIGYEQSGSKGLVLIFKCRGCGEVRRNVACREGEAPDDYERILALSQRRLPLGV